MALSPVKEKLENLPYLIFFQSKGGWPSFVTAATLEGVKLSLKHLNAIGLKPQAYVALSEEE